jgi:hypothetical protein
LNVQEEIKGGQHRAAEIEEDWEDEEDEAEEEEEEPITRKQQRVTTKPAKKNCLLKI